MLVDNDNFSAARQHIYAIFHKQLTSSVKPSFIIIELLGPWTAFSIIFIAKIDDKNDVILSSWLFRGS